MFRQRNLLVRFPVRDGSHVIARGRVSLYEARGEFQVVIEHIEEAGEGLLRRRFEELKQKLNAEGLFDSRHKKALPALPRRIGVITSPTGAAIRDILHILRRRFPAVPVLVYPVAVQGEAAPREIEQALRLAGQRRDCDVLIVARGGGSLEDLWAFNDETVARAIFACPIPIVSGVGHEVDVTIADFVADERAPTPSGAAERVVPDRAEWLRGLAATGRRLALASSGACRTSAARCSRANSGWRVRTRASACGSSRSGSTTSKPGCGSQRAIGSNDHAPDWVPHTRRCCGRHRRHALARSVSGSSPPVAHWSVRSAAVSGTRAAASSWPSARCTR